jgi:hypothetical protein
MARTPDANRVVMAEDAPAEATMPIRMAPKTHAATLSELVAHIRPGTGVAPTAPTYSDLYGGERQHPGDRAP